MPKMNRSAAGFGFDSRLIAMTGLKESAIATHLRDRNGT
jgi:hypothetical protein